MFLLFGVLIVVMLAVMLLLVGVQNVVMLAVMLLLVGVLIVVMLVVMLLLFGVRSVWVGGASSLTNSTITRSITFSSTTMLQFVSTEA